MAFTEGNLFVSTGVGTTVTSLAPSDLYNSFAYTLTAPALTTSAAVYDSNDVLQKTLWSAVTQTAGTHRAYWAGDMDDGSPATGTPPFYAKVLSHNVEYVWEGVIGNLSSSFTSSAVMVGLNNPTQSAVIVGSDLWVSVGYNEALQCMAKFALSDPHTRLSGILTEQGVSPNSIATDGTYMYWATGGGYDNAKAFCGAQVISTGENVTFSSGTSVTLYRGSYSAIDLHEGNPIVTVSTASPAVVTVSNSYAAGARFTFSTTGALPTGITAGTTYYVIATGLSGASFQFSTTPGGAAVNTSGTQSGQHKISVPGVSPTGISVDSSYIAVSHPAFDAVHVLNKTTGALVNAVSVGSLYDDTAICNQIAFDSGGSLWVISGTSVIEFTNPSVDSSTGTTITGFTHPLAVAIDSSGNVWVADGDDVQQVFKYSSAGALLDTFGDAGGYMTDPSVSTSKFWFYWPAGNWQQHTFICPDTSGGFWLGNSGNMQVLHIASDGTCDEVLQWSTAAYNVTVDHANPERVFCGFLEYEIDYTETLTAGETDAWTLVRNWTAGGPAGPFATIENSLNGGFMSVETLSNGRTYAETKQDGAYSSDIYELPSSGLPRHCVNIPAPSGGNYGSHMYENGDLRYIHIPTVGYGYTQTYYVRELTGFDGSHNPTWGSAVAYGSVLTSETSPWFRGGGFGALRQCPITSSGVLIQFDGSVESTATQNQGYHLGGVFESGTSFAWQTSPTGKLDGKGTYQTKAIDNSVNYGGNQVWAYDRHVFYGYHGENYRDLTYYQVGQANQFMHYYDDGLFIGQFGTPRITHFRPDADSHPEGCAGNSFYNTYAYASGNLYWYHGDEGVHGGVHRWRIDGIDTISEQSVTLNAFP